MNEGAALNRAGSLPHWQFRIVALASLVWNGLGCLDYILTEIRYPGYVQSFPPDLMSWIDAFPYWVTAAWGLAAGLSLAGAILLLLRSRRAVLAFLASFAFAAAIMVYRLFSGEMPASLDRAGQWLLDLLLLVLIAGQAWCARRASR